jgi:CO/xanthine dehydrogenase Mo-binding subunit
VFLKPRDASIGPRGLGELPMDGPAPAILNAIRHATGADLRAIPILPETLAEAVARSAS